MTGFTRQLARAACFVAFGATVIALPLGAQTVAQQGWNPQQILRTETYVHPPADVERIIMSPRTDISFTAPSPDRKWFLKATGVDRGDIEEYGKAHIYLGGVQVDTKANRARSLTTSTHNGLYLVDPRTMATKTIETPKGASISSQAWSPTGTQVAYIANFDDASQLYVADVATGKSVQVTKTPLLATLVTTVDWTADGKSLVVVQIPDGRGPVPTIGKNGDGVEEGPLVRLTESRKLPQVIHPSLLIEPHDKQLLKYYTTGQLAVIDVKSKAVRKVGAPGMIRSVDASPDGQYFRVTQMTEPFSYIVPVSSFGSVQELWDANGRIVATLNRTSLREGDQTGDGDVAAALGGRGAPQSSPSDTGKRNVQWNPVGPGLVYMQSVFATNAGAGNPAAAAPSAGGRGGGRGGRGGRGGGGGAGGAAQRTPSSIQYVNWLPPFGPTDTKVVYEGSGQLASVAFSSDGKTMFVNDSGAVSAMRTADPSKKFALGRGVTLPSGGGRGRGGGGVAAAADWRVPTRR